MITVAIIGTRKPDVGQREYAELLAHRLSLNYEVTIATGGAVGIDEAAMRGALISRLVVYLPWASYNNYLLPRYATCVVAGDAETHPDWFASVENYHPNPRALSRGMRALHARNFGIVSNSRLVLAFPSDDGGGGTGQGIRIAHGEGIPVMQFNRGEQLPAFETLLGDIVDTISGF